MTRQTLRGKSLTPLQGLLIILGFVVSIVLVSWLEQALDMATGLGNGRFIVWILIVVEAFFALRLTFKSYRYTLIEDRFVIEALYGDQARVVWDIPVNRVVALGPKDEIFKRYGNGQAYESATVKGTNLDIMALAWRRENGDATALLLLQPDEAMRAALEEALSKNGME